MVGVLQLPGSVDGRDVAGDSVVLLRRKRHVLMGDVDAANMIFFAIPYRWHEELSAAWFREIGHPLSSVIEIGEAFPFVRSAASYLRPLRLDEEVECVLVAQRAGKSSFDLRTYVMTMDGDLAVQVTTRQVYVRPDREENQRSCEMPPWLRAALTGTAV